MEYMNGGQLFYHLRKQIMFNDDLVQFYAAEMVLALDHLHSIGIIHRDLKPENILLDGKGHIAITDFGFAKEGILDLDQNSCKTICGTVEYMAPEMIKGTGHGKSVDWWSLGILIFDMLTGTPPFVSKNQAVLERKKLSKKTSNFPSS
jgi:serine/threonine protein kinase